MYACLRHSLREIYDGKNESREKTRERGEMRSVKTWEGVGKQKKIIDAEEINLRILWFLIKKKNQRAYSITLICIIWI